MYFGFLSHFCFILYLFISLLFFLFFFISLNLFYFCLFFISLILFSFYLSHFFCFNLFFYLNSSVFFLFFFISLILFYFVFFYLTSSVFFNICLSHLFWWICCLLKLFCLVLLIFKTSLSYIFFAVLCTIWDNNVRVRIGLKIRIWWNVVSVESNTSFQFNTDELKIFPVMGEH